MDWTLIVVAAIGLLGSGVLGGFIGSKANATKAISEAARNLIEPLGDRVKALADEVSSLSRENRELGEGVHILTSQLCEHEILPRWVPPQRFGIRS